MRHAPRYRRRRRHGDQSAYGRQLAVQCQLRAGPRFQAAPAKRWRPPLGRTIVVGAADDWRAAARAAVQADPRLRSDGRRTRLALLDALVDVHFPDTGRAIAGHAGLAARVSVILGRTVGRSTVGNHMRALEEDGWVGIEVHGRSAAIAGRNLAHVYRLLVAADREWTAQDDADLAAAVARLHPESVDGHHPVTVYREGLKVREDQSLNRLPAKKRIETRREDQDRRPARTHRERVDATVWVAEDLGLRPDDDGIAELLYVMLRFWLAGWSPRAVRAAIARTPLGVTHPPLPAWMRNLPGFIYGRLKPWLVDGRPVDAPIPALRPRPGRPGRAAVAACAPTVPAQRGAAADAEVAALREKLRGRAHRSVGRRR